MRLAFFMLLSLNYNLNAQNVHIKSNKVDSIFNTYNNNEVPGVSIGFIKDNKLEFCRSYGMSNLENDISINENTIFNLASVSKQFTAFAIVLLEEEGKLSLEDDVHKYIPELYDYGEKITLKQLANHTSGIRSHLQLLGLKGYISDNVITKQDALQIIFSQRELNFKPGEKYGYSNSGYVLLAEIVERVSGMSFPEFLKKRVFEPLQMNNTFVMDDYHKVIKNKAASYEIENGNYVNAPSNYSYYGSTGIYTSITDFSKWVLNFFNPKVGSDKLFKKMTTETFLNNGQTTGYGLGLRVGTYNGHTYINHSGGDAGYVAFMGLFPQHKAAVFLLSNNNTVNAEGKALEVADIMMTPSQQNNPPDHTQPLSENNRNTKIEIKNSELKQLEGHYLSNENFLIRNLIIKDGSLYFSRPEQNHRETKLIPIGKGIFQFDGNPTVTAEFRKEQEKVTINILMNGTIVETYDKYNRKTYTKKQLKIFEGSYYSPELDTTYKLTVMDDLLFVTHPKMGNIAIASVKKNGFIGSSWQFRFIEFEENNQEQITGLRVTADRARNIYFKRE